MKEEKFIEIASANPDVRVSKADPNLNIIFACPDTAGINREWVFQLRYAEFYSHKLTYH